MCNNKIKILGRAMFVLGLSLLGACGDKSSDATVTGPVSQAVSAQQSGDAVARVGEEEIHFSLLNTMLNSSAMVGLSIPALGTPERQQVIITLLDKAISANLLYLDALQQGVDQQPVYQEDIRRFEDAVLATLYREKVLYGDIQVSEEEIQDYFKRTSEEGDELTDDSSMAIEAKLRNDKLNTLKTRLRGRIREGATVEIGPDVLTLQLPGVRSGS